MIILIPTTAVNNRKSKQAVFSVDAPRHTVRIAKRSTVNRTPVSGEVTVWRCKAVIAMAVSQMVASPVTEAAVLTRRGLQLGEFDAASVQARLVETTCSAVSCLAGIRIGCT